MPEENDGIQSKYTELSKDLISLGRSIGKFTPKELYNINMKTEEIDAGLDKNNKKAEMYRLLKSTPDTKPIKHINLAIDIFSENFDVINKKMDLFDFYMKDIYSRIEKIGKVMESMGSLLKEREV